MCFVIYTFIFCVFKIFHNICRGLLLYMYVCVSVREYMHS